MSLIHNKIWIMLCALNLHCWITGNCITLSLSECSYNLTANFQNGIWCFTSSKIVIKAFMSTVVFTHKCLTFQGNQHLENNQQTAYIWLTTVYVSSSTTNIIILYSIHLQIWRVKQKWTKFGPLWEPSAWLLYTKCVHKARPGFLHIGCLLYITVVHTDTVCSRLWVIVCQ